MQASPIILGAGPAGLGAAYTLTQHGLPVVVLERQSKVGGLARTTTFAGHKFDVGPHRFYTKNAAIQQLWKDTLGDEFIPVPRLTRIYYNNKFFFYPLKPGNAILGLGLVEMVRILSSYLAQRLKRSTTGAISFEEWVTRKFGSRLYQIFFKTYTEKVWGIPCHEIGADWAAQRIKGLDLTKAILNAFSGKHTTKSLISTFWYPKQGAGQMYEALSQRIEAAGGTVQVADAVLAIEHAHGLVQAVRTKSGARYQVSSQLLASLPITQIAQILDPTPPVAVRTAAQTLKFRDHITVNLVVNRDDLFPDNWIYIHSAEVRCARIANYRNFSEAMCQPGQSGISVEYFAFDGDDLWTMSDQTLLELATHELAVLELVSSKNIGPGYVERQKDSYPAYYAGYEREFSILRDYLSGFENLILIGRAGMYKYNNMDHALLTGMMAAENCLGAAHNLWDVNAEDDYLETIELSKQLSHA